MPSKAEYLRLRPMIAALGYQHELTVLDNHYELVHVFNREGTYQFTL